MLLPSEKLNRRLVNSAKKLGIDIHMGRIHSSDVFYRESLDHTKTIFDEHQALCVEMESFGLFANAKFLNKEAACLLTISDSFVSKEETTPEQRETSFTQMMEIALNSIFE